jgi:predicted PurR-regulated permease PerM
MIKKTLAILLMIISLIFFIGALVGLGGTWIIRAKLLNIVDNTTTLANEAIVSLVASTDEVNTGITQIQTNITNIDTMLGTIGTKVDENNSTVAAIDGLVNTDLIPPMESLVTTTSAFHDQVVALTSILEVMDQIPPFNAKLEVLDKAKTVAENINLASQGIQDLKNALIDKKTGLTDKTIFILTTPLDRASSSITDTKDILTEVQQPLSDIQAALSTFQSSVTAAATAVSVFLTVVLAWLALSQISLFAQGLKTLANQQARKLSQEKATTIEADQVSPKEVK